MLTCPVCGTSRIYGDGKWKICGQCGIEFRHPYEIPDYHATKPKIKSKHLKRARRQAEYLQEHGVDSVLDFGCGCGRLVDIIGGVGVELNDVLRGDNDSIHEGLGDVEGRFSCAVMSHVLEHIPDPVEALLRIRDYAPMLYVEVPHVDNSSAKCAPGHILAFDKFALTNVLEYGGWKVEEIWRTQKEICALCSMITR